MYGLQAVCQTKKTICKHVTKISRYGDIHFKLSVCGQYFKEKFVDVREYFREKSRMFNYCMHRSFLVYCVIFEFIYHVIVKKN